MFKLLMLSSQLMQDSPDLRSVGTLQQLMRILNFYHEECISKDLRSDPLSQYNIHLRSRFL